MTRSHQSQTRNESSRAARRGAGSRALVALLAAAWAGAAGVPTAAQERIVVPLTRPGQPVTLRVDLLYGGLSVEAYPGEEVVVETRAGGLVRGEGRHRSDGGGAVVAGGDTDEDSSEAARKERSASRGARPETDRRAGLRRIPNESIGLTIEEEDNEVTIESESWRRAVDLKVLVPARTSVEASCVNNGDIELNGVEGDLELENVNGSIRVRGAAGAVLASTTNGEVRVSFARLVGNEPMAFASFNGSVDLTFPPDLAATLDLKSEQGEIFTDFDLAVEKAAPRAPARGSDGRFRVEVDRGIRGRIGAGGREIRAETFNGDIYIRRNPG